MNEKYFLRLDTTLETLVATKQFARSTEKPTLPVVVDVDEVQLATPSQGRQALQLVSLQFDAVKLALDVVQEPRVANGAVGDLSRSQGLAARKPIEVPDLTDQKVV